VDYAYCAITNVLLVMAHWIANASVARHREPMNPFIWHLIPLAIRSAHRAILIRLQLIYAQLATYHAANARAALLPARPVTPVMLFTRPTHHASLHARVVFTAQS